MPIQLELRPPLSALFREPRPPSSPVIGLFVCSADPNVTEICAGAGFDYLVIDTEHAPGSLQTTLRQLQVIAAYPTRALVRVPEANATMIKQVLDLGAQNLLIPMVHNASDAELVARAMEYPPRGVRGVGSALARSARWNRVPNYLAEARSHLSALVQVESAEAVDNAYEIASTDGIDGIFIGPSDLAASMGVLGQQSHREVVAAVKHVIGEVHRAGKFVGVNAFVTEQAREYLAAGADFVNVGADVALLARTSESLAAAYRSDDAAGADIESY